MTKFKQTYPTDLKYTEWMMITDFFPASPMGRPRKWEMWQIINAILYVVRTGCQWRMLPKDFAPWQTVYGYFRRWKRQGLWERINEALVVGTRFGAVVRSDDVRAGPPEGDSAAVCVRCRRVPLVLARVWVGPASLARTAAGRVRETRLG